jgi:hypothetical protein
MLGGDPPLSGAIPPAEAGGLRAEDLGQGWAGEPDLGRAGPTPNSPFEVGAVSLRSAGPDLSPTSSPLRESKQQAGG